MIRTVTDKESLYAALGEHRNIYTEKIRSLADAYGFGYDFCRFWAQDGGAVVGSYYGDATAADCGDISAVRAEELSAFIGCGQFGRALMPYELYERLGGGAHAQKRLLMKAGGSIVKTDDIDKVRTYPAVSISEIYEIANSGFDIDFNKWYTDTSHMLRHGTAQLYTLGGSSCAVKMFSSGGITYLSYICTLPGERGKGLAKRLISHICTKEAEAGNEVFLFCEEELRAFYEKADFVPAGCAADIHGHTYYIIQEKDKII